MPRGIQDSSKRNFVKKGKIHQAQKGTSASRQQRSLERASKGPKSIKLRKIRREKCPQKFISPTKKKARQAENPKGRSRQKLGPKKKKKRKTARLKTQKGGLGKSQGQRKEEEEEKEKNWKILPSWKLEDAT